MSSKPSAPDRQAAPPPEKKAPSGPVVTPQVLAIILGIILVVALIVYYQAVVVKFNNEKQQVASQIAQTNQNIQTYTKKGNKLEEAREVSLALREKLNTLDYLFLQDQSSVIPLFENTLFPLIESSRMRPGKVVLEGPYTFYINTAMSPFQTLPASAFFEDAEKTFPVIYRGEKNGVPVEAPLDTRPDSFLEPFTMTFEEFQGTFEDVQRFVERIQTTTQDQLITVHCLKNDDSKNAGLYRTSTEWTIAITVYFMNPEKSASGETPPAPPGSKTC
jgi:hypothetical protein